jgi:hypothetical protein
VAPFDVDKENEIGYFTLTGVNQNCKRSGFGRKIMGTIFCFANETNINTIKKVHFLKKKFRFI